MKSIYKTVGVLAAIACAAVLTGAVKDVKDNLESDANEFAKKSVESKRSDINQNAINTAEKIKGEVDILLKKEKETADAAIQKELESKGYFKGVNDARNAFDMAINKIKDDICYDAKKNAIKDQYEESIQNYKNSTHLDETKRALRRRKKDAEETYSKQLATLRLTIGSGNEGYSAMRRAFRAERDRVIDECDSKIKVLDNSFNDYQSDANRKMKDDISNLDSKFEEATREIKKAYSESRKALDGFKQNVEKEVYSEVQSKRTFADEELLRLEERWSKASVDILCNEAREIGKMKAGFTYTDKLGIALAKRGYRKASVAFATSLPMAALVYVLYKYSKWAAELLKAVENASSIYKKG
jgi:hypothetical protein